MKHVVMYSGGVGSYSAAKRVIAQHGKDDVTLLFTDTRMEDKDLYRFLDDTSKCLGIPVTTIAEGRNPWHVFFDVKFLGNSRVDPCSKHLKRDMADKWLIDNCLPAETVVYVGIDWTEEHRFTRLATRRKTDGWMYEAPLCQAPYISKRQMFDDVIKDGIKIPRLYEMGFSHNNCGGFCIKAGQGHYANLLKHLPERYADHEAKEQAIRVYLGKDVSMMQKMRNGVKSTFTLKDLREQIEKDATQVDMLEIGGCGCFLDEGAVA